PSPRGASGGRSTADDPEPGRDDVGADSGHPEEPIESAGDRQDDQEVREFPAREGFEERALLRVRGTADDAEIDRRHGQQHTDHQKPSQDGDDRITAPAIQTDGDATEEEEVDEVVPEDVEPSAEGAF